MKRKEEKKCRAVFESLYSQCNLERNQTGYLSDFIHFRWMGFYMAWDYLLENGVDK